MAVITTQRKASFEEIVREMDRRGSVIEALEAERNLFKGKYRALLKLVSRARDKLVDVTDHIEDEGDRRYFGSTNDADALRELYNEMMSWIWDAVDKVNRMQGDPYASIREQRARADAAEAALAAKDAEIERLREVAKSAADQLTIAHDDAFKQASGYGVVTTDGRDFSCFELNRCSELARQVRDALKGGAQ